MEAKFVIETTMEKQDYRKFLYLATFCRSKILAVMGGIAFIGSALEAWVNDFGIVGFIIIWGIIMLLAIAVICFQVEHRNNQRVKTDRTGTFDSINVLEFYEDKIVIKNQQLCSTAQLQYSQFYELMESKEYYIFYVNKNQASLLRKKDIADNGKFYPFILSKFEGRYRKIFL